MVLYQVWPLPFWLFAHRVILPGAYQVGRIYRLVASPFEVIPKIYNLEQRNQELVQENVELRSRVAKAREERDLCLASGKESEKSWIEGYELMVARVVGRTPRDISQKIVIDRGRDDGVKEGAAVLALGHLVGRVDKALSHRSEVLLVSSHFSLVPAVLETSREIGLVQGGLEGLILTEIPASLKVESGEKVITGSLGDDLPSGILIGQASKTTRGKGLFQQIKLDYPVNISSLEVVSVVK